MASFGRKHPLLAGILTDVVFELSMMITATLLVMFAPSFFMSNGDFVYQGTVECFVALVGIGLVYLFKLDGMFNERGSGFFGGLFVGLYFIVISLFSLAVTGLQAFATNPNPQFEPGWKIAVYFITMMLVGLAEEIFFRGVVSNLFYEKHANDPAGVWTSVIATGLIFGLMHLTNALGSDLEGVIVQVFAVSAMGMALTAVYYRCRNIWAMVFIHGFLDICAAFTSGILQGGSISAEIGSYDVSQCISAAPYVILTLVLLRPSKIQEIVKKHPKNAQIVAENELSDMLDDRIRSSKRSKLGCAAAVVSAVIIMSSLLMTAIYVSGGFDSSVNQSDVLQMSHAGEWNGEDRFEYTSKEFTAESADYRMTIRSFPTNKSTYVTVSVVDQNGIKYYTQSFGGVNSTSVELSLYSDKTYRVVLEYDYSSVEEYTICSYSTTVVISKL